MASRLVELDSFRRRRTLTQCRRQQTTAPLFAGETLDSPWNELVHAADELWVSRDPAALARLEGVVRRARTVIERDWSHGRREDSC